MTGLNKISFAAALALALAATPAAAQDEYAAKFVCGSATKATMVVPGAYLTAVNVHNPHDANDDIRWKVAVAGANLTPGGVTDYERFALREDEVVDIDCRIITKRLAAAGFPVTGAYTGFLVIQTARPLDVVAVYTAGGLSSASAVGTVASFHTERVPARPIRD